MSRGEGRRILDVFAICHFYCKSRWSQHFYHCFLPLSVQIADSREVDNVYLRLFVSHTYYFTINAKNLNQISRGVVEWNWMHSKVNLMETFRVTLPWSIISWLKHVIRRQLLWCQEPDRWADPPTATTPTTTPTTPPRSSARAMKLPHSLKVSCAKLQCNYFLFRPPGH